MSELRNWVEAILYGGGSNRRFTQDGPVLPDVWTEYLADAFKSDSDRRISVLIEPHFDSTPGLIAQRLKEQLKERFDATQTVYNRTVVSSWLTLNDLLDGVIPLTRWYADIAQSRDASTGKEIAFDRTLPAHERLWDDLTRSDSEGGYAFKNLLAFIRIAGVTAHVADITTRIAGVAARIKSENDEIARNALHAEMEGLRAEMEILRADIRNAVEDIKTTTTTTTTTKEQGLSEGQNKIARMALHGWALLGGKLPDKPPKPPRGKKLELGSASPIYAINRNREVRMALTYSVKTVKADAAKRLFDLDCKAVTWAVIDCGIDATHPAVTGPSGTRSPRLRAENSAEPFEKPKKRDGAAAPEQHPHRRDVRLHEAPTSPPPGREGGREGADAGRALRASRTSGVR